MKHSEGRGSQAIWSCRALATVVVMAAIMLGNGCASRQSFIDTPRISLTDVELTRAGFDGQTFVLSFDVDNPNPFPLPVTRVRYQILLADEKFASGEARSQFSIPASGNGDFDLQVDLNILQQASNLVSVVRNGMRHEVEYQLQGSLSVDIPYVRPITFTATGSVQIAGSRF